MPGLLQDLPISNLLHGFLTANLCLCSADFGHVGVRHAQALGLLAAVPLNLPVIPAAAFSAINKSCMTQFELFLQILAKLASGMHKPSQQTLVPLAAVPGLLQDLPISKLRQLGGKFGDELMASLNIKTVGMSAWS